HSASEAVVRGVMGQSARLPCYYQVARPTDISDMCWGRGPCPNSKCNDKILHTTGNRVTFRKSQQYNLKGYISHGDVSLTIQKVKAEDAGTYCCRVEIPGWFNDIKQNIQLEVLPAPPETTTTTRKTPVSPPHFKRTTTVASQVTSDHQTTAEAAVFLTTTIPEAKTETTESAAVITLETIAAPTFAVTEDDAFQETTVTISTFPDFSGGFQVDDMRTEEDYTLFVSESVPLPEVTTELLSTLPATEETESAHTSLMVEDLLVTDISELLAIRATHSCVNRSEVNMLLKPFEFFSSAFQFLSYAILIACLVAAFILFTLVPSVLFWKRKHTEKFIIKSLQPARDLEKVFSGPEGETSMLSL
ncbi:HAVR1 protein, partial [Eubucco bourcierii]|nr:HAVR1 protein [Eubucco bourcierii]